jgi:hypothetical protein
MIGIAAGGWDAPDGGDVYIFRSFKPVNYEQRRREYRRIRSSTW